MKQNKMEGNKRLAVRPVHAAGMLRGNTSSSGWFTCFLCALIAPHAEVQNNYSYHITSVPNHPIGPV